ncbi:Host attachment protein [Hyella patelloides LEGE 07179]|uniref:Host attachment protein n=1 Tax=Hyella patelloides LEGE 07179 TaxID=945734 RepID=A0A563W4W7_9CYAN|nr:host attachment protein [Hyella patelloides]VEP18715.1 Host attachment protein [Hyella patelloides LEGE 07179]
MGKFAVAVINGTQARFFTLDSAATSEYESSPNLIEHKCLVNSTRELHGQELWANTKTGRNKGSNGQAHGYDDHRQNHEIEFEKRFANKISSAMGNLIQIHQARHLVIVAEPQILGMMREAMTDSLFKNLNVHEVAKDICNLKSNQIHDYLAKKELLPACQKVYSR